MALKNRKKQNKIRRVKKNFHFNVVLRSEKEGGFTVTVPTLPGCVTHGKDLNEAKKMAIEAIELYLESLEQRGEDIPSDKESLFTSVDVQALVYA